MKSDKQGRIEYKGFTLTWETDSEEFTGTIHVLIVEKIEDKVNVHAHYVKTFKGEDTKQLWEDWLYAMECIQQGFYIWANREQIARRNKNI